METNETVIVKKVVALPSEPKPGFPPSVHIPYLNEIAAIRIGRDLTNPDASPEARAEAKRVVELFEGFNAVYVQNTADEMNIVVPEFESWDKAMRGMSDSSLEGISGGEGVVIFGTLAGIFGGLGVAFGFGALSVSSATGAITGATVAAVAAGVAITVALSAAAVLVVGTAVGVGVGVAAGMGAFSGSSGHVNVGLVG